MQVFKSVNNNIIIAGDIIFHDRPAFLQRGWGMTTTIQWRSPIDLITSNTDMDILTDRCYCINYMPYVYEVRGDSWRYLIDCINLSACVTTCVLKKCDIQQPEATLVLLWRILDLLY
jgi:hypothetical protein